MAALPWQALKVTQSDAPPAVRPEEKTSPARRASLVAWVCLLIVWVVWGSTYLAIRVGVETMPPLLMAAARNLIAGDHHVPGGSVFFSPPGRFEARPSGRRLWRRALVAPSSLLSPGRAAPLWLVSMAEPRRVDRVRDRRHPAAGGQRGGGHRRADRALRAGRAAGRHRAAVAARHRRDAEPRPARPGPAGRAGPGPGRRRLPVRAGRQLGPRLRGRRGHHLDRRVHLGPGHDHDPPGRDPVQPGPGQRDGTAVRRRGPAGPVRGHRGVRLAAPGPDLRCGPGSPSAT